MNIQETPQTSSASAVMPWVNSKEDDMIKIEIIVDENYVNMDVKGDIKISYPIWGDKKDKQLQKFISDIKKAISGKRISTLS